MPDLLELLGRRPVVCAEGYLFECERRGYLQAGAFVPEVVLDHPEVVEGLHREFVHAGSDVVEAFTYYGHRQKLRVIGKEDILEPLNRQALAIAAKVAGETGTLLACNLCNTNVYEPGTPAAGEAKAAFEEQVAWAAEAGADMVIAETFSWLGEALLALEAISAAGLPAVVTFAVHREGTLRDEPSPAEACRRAEQAGATVVGLNCIRGPRTMLPLLGQIREAVSCEVAALPVPYRTTEAEPSMQALRDPERGRGGGQDAPGIALLPGHDQALVPRHRPRHRQGLPGIRGQPVAACPGAGAGLQRRSAGRRARPGRGEVEPAGDRPRPEDPGEPPGLRSEVTAKRTLDWGEDRPDSRDQVPQWRGWPAAGDGQRP